MLLQIAQVLPPALLAQCLALAESGAQYVDGKQTAGWHAKQRKNNLQARPDAALKSVFAQIEKALLAHELVVAAGRPKSIVRLLLSRYEAGMSYGTHVDDAIMSGQRTDLSFTLFLNAPEQYEGGNLVVDEPAGERAFKLDAGSMLLYPSTTLHRVEPLTSGKRIVIVGWIRSLVRDAQEREILFDLERVIALQRAKQEQDGATLELMLKTRSNLLRKWAED